MHSFILGLLMSSSLLSVIRIPTKSCSERTVSIKSWVLAWLSFPSGFEVLSVKELYNSALGMSRTWTYFFFISPSFSLSHSHNHSISLFPFSYPFLSTSHPHFSSFTFLTGQQILVHHSHYIKDQIQHLYECHRIGCQGSFLYISPLISNVLVYSESFIVT